MVLLVRIGSILILSSYFITGYIPGKEVFVIVLIISFFYSPEFACVPEAIEYINSNYNYWKGESEKIVSETTVFCYFCCLLQIL